MVAFAKMPSFGCIQEYSYVWLSDKFVEYTQIHPLVIDKVVVKAKKMKEDNVKDSSTVRDKGEKDEDKPGDNDDP